MGAPKQKWTSEEEDALRAGVLKYGLGKWRIILKDPVFGGVLHQRSNVDLKDKWRNMPCLENGLGSREKARLGLNKMHQSDEDTSEAKADATSSDSQQIGGSRKSMIRLDDAIMEAINKLNESGGSKKPAITAYIKDQYCAPPNFKGLVSAKLKYLTATGELVKEKQKYRIATTTTLPERRNPSISLLEGRQELSPNTKYQIESELDMMWSMAPGEAAVVAARAVADAEAALAEAEEAIREAEEAEAEADAAQFFAEALMKTCTVRKLSYDDGEPGWWHDDL